MIAGFETWSQLVVFLHILIETCPLMTLMKTGMNMKQVAEDRTGTEVVNLIKLLYTSPVCLDRQQGVEEELEEP